MNDRSVEDEIDKIRLQIYEETKGLTKEQYAERMRRIGEEFTKEYGIRLTSMVE